jgi:hypothetical protein
VYLVNPRGRAFTRRLYRNKVMHEMMRGMTRKNKNNYETFQKKNTCHNRHSIFFHALQTTKEKKFFVRSSLMQVFTIWV